MYTRAQVRLREYFQQTRHVHRGRVRRQLLTLMSPQLQGEVCIEMNQKWLQRVNFLRGAERELVVLVAVALQPAVFAPSEHMHMDMYTGGGGAAAGRVCTQ